MNETLEAIDPATANLADLSDARIEAMVREEPRAAEVLLARAMYPALSCEWRDDSFGRRADWIIGVDDKGWGVVPRPLTDPAAAWDLLEWARRAPWLRGFDLSADDSRHWRVWWDPDSPTGGVWCEHSESLAAALVMAALKAAAWEVRGNRGL
jgi:hypothetical protein